MKFIKVFLFVFLAFTVGIGVAVYRLAGYENSDAFFHNGSWLGSKNLPLGKDNLLTAQVTCFALFALPGEEAIYLFAMRDEEKGRLHSSNDYVIRGNINQIHAKYWSITLYAKDLFLSPNSIERYSFNNINVETDKEGNFSIIVSHNSHEGNWLPSPENARFGFLFRIYRGEKEYLDHLSTSQLPEIKKVHR